jgi:glycosyltransferase involved in cell wall biosynthesis
VSELPSISIVTPSYNQGRFLDACMRSILDQGYPGLEYVVVDGGSVDGSAEVIRGHEDRLAWWVIEPDEGQYDAINKGFAKTSGEVMAWLNSDDLYMPWSLAVVGEVFAAFPQVEWITTAYPLAFDERGRAVECRYVPAHHRDAFLRGHDMVGPAFNTGYIQQESTFWRRSLWERAGGSMDTSYRLAADFELWARFFGEAELFTVHALLGGFRTHGEQKTAGSRLHDYGAEAVRALRRHGGRPYGSAESWLRSKLAGRRPVGPTYRGQAIKQNATGRWIVEQIRFA